MFSYIIILLDNTSVSFCHYPKHEVKRRLISKDTLHKAIHYAMMQNMAIQFVYPDYEIPNDIKQEIENVDSCRIMPVSIADGNADVVVVDGWDFNKAIKLKKNTIVRVNKSDFFERYLELIPLIESVIHLNLVIIDINKFTAEDTERYTTAMNDLCTEVGQMYLRGEQPQFNLLTDRLLLKQMNNCSAGVESVTLSDEGDLYVCPAFYIDGSECICSLDDAIANDGEFNIKNGYLYNIDFAPICRHCDAWQCKRCVWINRNQTLEVNTPSHEQCIVAHIERESSRKLLIFLKEKGDFAFENNIKKLDYLDPFDIRDEY